MGRSPPQRNFPIPVAPATYSPQRLSETALQACARDNVDVRRPMQLHGMIQVGQAETGAKTIRFVPSEATVLTLALA
jgi:hypothetical protein